MKNKLTILTITLSLFWAGSAIAGSVSSANPSTNPTKTVTFGKTTVVGQGAGQGIKEGDIDITPALRAIAQDKIDGLDVLIKTETQKLNEFTSVDPQSDETMSEIDEARANITGYNKAKSIYESFTKGDSASISELASMVAGDLVSKTTEDVFKMTPKEIENYASALKTLSSSSAESMGALQAEINNKEVSYDELNKKDKGSADAMAVKKEIDILEGKKMKIEALQKITEFPSMKLLQEMNEALLANPSLSKAYYSRLSKAYSSFLGLEPIDVPEKASADVKKAITSYNSTVGKMKAVVEKLTTLPAMRDTDRDEDQLFNRLQVQVTDLDSLGKDISAVSDKISSRSIMGKIGASLYSLGRSIPGLSRLFPPTDEETLKTLQTQVNEFTNNIDTLDTTSDDVAGGPVAPSVGSIDSTVIAEHPSTPSEARTQDSSQPIANPGHVRSTDHENENDGFHPQEDPGSEDGDH